MSSSAPEPSASPDASTDKADTHDKADSRGKIVRRQQLERLIRDGSLQIEIYLELAAIHRSEDRPLEARRVLQQALQLNKEDPKVLWEFEEATLARSLQQVREVSELASRLHTPEVDREMQRAQTDWANRRLEVCRARLARDPSLVHLRLIVAEALYDLGFYNEAFEETLPCTEVDSLSPNAYLIQGKCLLDLGKDLEALAAFRAAAMRRAVIAPPKTRLLAMRCALEIAQRHHLTLSAERYRHALETAEHDLAKSPS